MVRTEKAIDDAKLPRARQQTAILDAVMDGLVDQGYQQLTVEGVAARAGVHKTTLYRWWSGKPALVANALANRMVVGPVPDTGTTRGDLIAWIEVTIANYAGTRAGIALPALIGDLASTPDGVTAFREAFLAERRAGCAELVRRGISRGDLPAHTDVELFLDALAGTVFYRQLVSGVPFTTDLPGRLVDLLLGTR
ncbi:TetR/AcrR family transcriptional regulator [Nocardioides sp. CFH 31398]|uniref:TetR/AcrR family transcriptional regulator n=1 Tax=Nocardioides sp. CFH 31398 TaxID=2919579 RepID=UPI001F05ABD7|nr:TetR/AcrR family transcriptional regulator [Nocardioides sp. CFH 31398]MCH1866937.1 TetR/AcrR family transcriptional regulator [Nocardioides sp. CFH 31398]